MNAWHPRSYSQPASSSTGLASRCARTYVFTDPDGEELCLRPDLTIPTARVFLERNGQPPHGRFCYNGPAFRIQEGKPDPLRPREFRQAGIEYYGEPRLDADLEVLRLTIEAVRRAGVKSFLIKAGHIGLFTALLNALSMPARWRERLAHSFWRAGDFARELRALSRRQGIEPLPLPASELSAESLLASLDERSIPFIGLRTPEEIVKRLAGKAADAGEAPLPQETVQVIEAYLKTGGSVTSALDAIEGLFGKAKLEPGGTLTGARTLFEHLKVVAGPAPILFDAGFGRHFEYYTGMVFQIEIEGGGVAGHIAGGGRYDGLIRALSGGSRDVPAVGAAVHTERLLAASRR
jgi:ATP phosphoribosyltransferase regulatory subunit